MTARHLRLLVVTGGHSYDEAAFSDFWNSMPGIDWVAAKQPLAQELLSPEGAAAFDAVAFYDIPGIRFRKGAPPEIRPPSPAFRARFERLIASGKPMLFLHHAIAGWPAWDRYAEVIGARFFYQPGCYKGAAHHASGYLEDVHYTARPHMNHPVTEGLESGVELEDELYLFQILEADITPLLIADYDFSGNPFLCADAQLRGESTPATSADACTLAAWARQVGPAPIVVIQPGHGALTFANPGYRRLISNALRWLVSEAATTLATGQENPA